MIQKIYIAEDVFPVPQEAKDIANQLGATIIYSGVPYRLLGIQTVDNQVLSEDSRGYFEYNELEPEIPANNETRTIPLSAIEDLKANLADPTINSIAEVKSVLTTFLNNIG